MEDGIERSISILLDTIQRIKPSEKKQETPPIPLEEPKESNDKKEKKD
jgi:hypothetical protein